MFTVRSLIIIAERLFNNRADGRARARAVHRFDVSAIITIF